LESLVFGHNLTVICIPTLDELLVPTIDPLPWNIKYCRDFSEPFVLLHTSGSTGSPKVVNVTHGLYATLDFHQQLATGKQCLNVREWADRELYITLPPFHAAGLNFFGWSVFHGTVLILGPADQPPSVSTVELALDLDLAKAGVVAPSILEEFVRDSHALSKIARWSSVSFGGGPLSRAAGDALWEKTRVHNLLGSTEMNTLPEFVPASKDEWLYHNFHPSQGIEFRHRQDNLHELVIVRHRHWRTYQAIFWTFPQLDEYCSKDLYEQHSDKPNLWAYRGRLDDIIVLSNGEKFCPAVAESIVTGHPHVKSAMIVGGNHAQAALLVEPLSPAIENEHRRACQRSFLDAVQEANRTLPQHAQIHASHIKILPPSQSFLRSPKGEVRRAATVALLSSVISDLYASADIATGCVQASQINFGDEPSLISCLADLLSSDLYLGRAVDPDNNIFQCGFDSLRVTRLLRHIKTSMASQGIQPAFPLTSRMIYQNPSCLALASALLQLTKEGSKSNLDDGDSSEMSRLLETFSEEIEALANSPTNHRTVILTGSTGSLGSYILDTLVRSEKVQRVICLNRSRSSAERQTASHSSRGLTEDFGKVSFIETELAKNQLGLGADAYHELTSKTTHIIHNSWPVDFNLKLSSFEPQLAGCLQLLTMAANMPLLQSLSFVSSVGVASGWTKRRSFEVPELKIEDLSAAGNMGYAQSKLLAELILAQGCDSLKIPVSIYRVGQIAGPVLSSKGMWSPKEWFPSILLTCKHLGKIPINLGALDCMDWIPVDILAGALAEALLSDSSPNISGKTRYMHFVNPKKAYWTNMAHEMSHKLNPDRRLEIVAFTEWLDCLKRASEEPANIDDIPAIRLLDFLKDMAQQSIESASFSTENTEHLSSTLKEMRPVSIEWMEHWIKQWKRC
jgi:thioester reductase-like protein/aryl carrier-like protein